MSTSHSNGHFDLEAAAKAAASEASQRPVEFTYKGAEYTIPPGREWPVSAVVAVGDGQLGKALPLLLGAEAYERLISAGLTSGELEFLVQLVAREAGFGTLGDFQLPAAPSSTPT